MNDKLEKLIALWGRQEETSPSASSQGSEHCLSYQQAEQVARGALEPAPGFNEHLESCPRCRGLLEDFAEALAEDAPEVSPHIPIVRAGRSRILRIGYIAAAASILLAVGLSVYFRTREARPQPETILASAQVGLQSNIESGLFPKGKQQFESGQAIMFQVQLRRDGHLTLLNLDPRGRIVALPPIASSSALTQPVQMGIARPGPYRLDDTTGHEIFLIIVTEREVTDIPDRISKLQLAYDRDESTETLVELIRCWPADLEVISFEHIPPTQE